MKSGDNKQRADNESSLQKGKQPLKQNRDDKPRVTTVVPDNDSGKPGAPAKTPAHNKK